MTRFKTAVRGYDKKQVDAYVEKINEHNEKKIHELEDCVERFKQENDYLYAKNAEYRRNEERVSGAILQAMEIKGSIEKEMRTKIALEEDRLLAFKNKWTAYARRAEKNQADRVVEDLDAYIASFRENFVKNANRDLRIGSEGDIAERSYRSEKERVTRAKSKGAPEKKISAADLFQEDFAAPNTVDPFGFEEE